MTLRDSQLRALNRAAIKQMAPPFLKGMFDRVRDRLNGPGIEYAVLKDIMFQPDPSAVPRINLAITDLSRAAAFGGVMTGLRLFNDLAYLLAPAGIEARIVTEKDVGPEDNAALSYPALANCPFHVLSRNMNVLPIRAGDIFIAFNWWISLNLEPALRAQAIHFGREPMPKIQLIQEYEPGFYPFSAAHLLAREAMGGHWPVWAVLNTRELQGYWAAQGHRAAREYVFEPRMNSALRPFADDLRAQEKEKILLVYGRPQIPRNAFYLIRRCLEHWAEHHGSAHRDWRILSVGEQHEDMDLGGGHRLQSLGKASLQDYALLLRKAAVGLSLMVSPHPSYPPLEMAHFGVRVLTNAYGNKHMANRHENLLVPDGIRPEEIAGALEQQIQAFEADPAIGIAARSHMPDYLREDRVECVADLADDLKELLLVPRRAEEAAPAL